MKVQPSRIRTVALITALVLIWGISWPIYKVALAYTPPILFAGMRTLFGGLALAFVSLPGWRNIRFRRHWRVYLISAFFNVLLFFGLQTVGLTYMPGGLFSVITYFQPVLVGLMAWAWLRESMSPLKLAGLILGFLGVAVVSADGLRGEVSAVGIVLALLTAVSWAFGAVYLKKAGGQADPLWLVSLQSMFGGAVLTSIGSFSESWTDIVWNVPYVGGLLFGSLLGVPTAWVIYFVLVRSGDTSKVAASTFLVPLIAVAGGCLFLHEPFNALFLAGLVLIVTSIYLVNRSPGGSAAGLPGRTTVRSSGEAPKRSAGVGQRPEM